MENRALRPHQVTLLIASAATIIGWALPIVQTILMPLQYLNTHLHEFSHALVSTATGGYVKDIIVNQDTSGVTLSSGGSIYLVAMAGYVGAAISGALIVMSSGTQGGARTTLRVLSILLACSMALWVRGDAIGILTGLLWIGLLWAISLLKGSSLLFASQFIGVQQCLSSVQSIYVLMKISTIGETHSDAGIMQAATGIPAIFWATAWCVLSVALLTVAARWAWRQERLVRAGSPGAGR